ncbi:diguanylate cyclase (GGDEF)-like protein [Herbihabitans rhizosphaerae]|uniref:Diguanylate cyclase (GGDEF)-like protein n=1 Tax=Herbihabitans rhizosphaerae TaxID=1872711 RepID=A0A4Q7KMX0_9PSEU|nr:sensor domain-containing diguanylate cyclase [Herbihabitans rhizosphaerae]RZS37666.1 diguanylate cyclase (GGDEF)-like protein [Herbihabitans rhizosphaerae]
MSTVAAVAPALAGTIWDELVADFPAGVMLLDERGQVLAANSQAGEQLGITPTDLLDGRVPDGWVARDDFGKRLPSTHRLANQVLRADVTTRMPVVITIDGRPHSHLIAEIRPLAHRGRPRLLLFLRPVHRDVAHTAGLLDPLTGLPARPVLLDRLEQSLIRARTHGHETTLVLADLCGMSEINERVGFDRGDELLTVTARRLRDGVRADHTVARLAGSTFAILADHPHGTGEPVADRVRELIEVPVALGRISLCPKVNTGWATSDGTATVLEMITQAERPR